MIPETVVQVKYPGELLKLAIKYINQYKVTSDYRKLMKDYARSVI